MDTDCLVPSSSTGAHEKAAHRISMAVAVPEGLSVREKQHSIALLWEGQKMKGSWHHKYYQLCSQMDETRERALP